MLSEFQRGFVDDFKTALANGEKDIFLLAGGAGSGKSFLCLLLLHALALEFGGARFGVFRKSRQVLKTNTMASFSQMLSLTNTSKSCVMSDFCAKYKNESEILFLWVDPSKDPDNNNIKGLELTGALFEEVNQLERESFYTVKSRVGRRNSLTSQITSHRAFVPPFVLANCNPNNSWVKSEFYDPYVEGVLPENIYFSESFPVDNPYLETSYVNTLKSLPQEQRERYLNNNWHYSDNPNALISLEDYLACVS